MSALATICKKAGLLGLFLWLAPVALSSPLMAQSMPLRLQIEQAVPILDERTREPMVSFRLTARSGRMFGEFTSRNIGRTIEIRVDGKVVMRPIVREPIMGGSVQLSGGLTLTEAKELADRLNSGSARVEAEVVD